QRLGEATYGEFGGVVGSLSGNRENPEEAGNVDDVPVSGGDQMRQECFGAVHYAPEVDVHHPLDVLELADFNITGEGDPGVVINLVDLAEVLVDRVGIGQECLAFADVETVRFDRRADGLDPLFGLCQAFGVDVADR